MRLFKEEGEEKMKFQIVSDSSCEFTPEDIDQCQVSVVSFYVTFGDGASYREGKDITAVEFYQRMVDQPDVFPTTSTPTIQDYLDAFLPLVEAGSPVLCICINGQFSSSLQTAQNARQMILEDHPQAEIYVMDSRLVTVLQNQFVREAVRLRNAGATLAQAVAALEPIRDTGHIFFTTRDLEYLRHGGRNGKAAATAGALLNVKPLIEYTNCELLSGGIAKGRKQSMKKAIDRCCRHLERTGLDIRDYRVATGYGLDREEYLAFTQQVIAAFREMGLEGLRPLGQEFHIGVTIGVHTGPYPIGLGYLKRAALPEGCPEPAEV